MQDTIELPFDELIESGEHRLDQAGSPRPYLPEVEAKARTSVLALLKSYPVMHLATVDEAGWPVGGGALYLTLSTPDGRPVLYVLADRASAEVKNIRREPRVSLTVFDAFGFERRRESRSLRLQGVARVVADREEENHVRALAARVGEPLASALGPDLAIVRIEGAWANVDDRRARLRMGAVDYGPAHLDETERELAARGRLSAVIEAIEHLPGEVVAIDLKSPRGQPALPAYAAGSHIQIFVRDGLVRPYSLCAAANEDGVYRIGVLREPQSRGGSEEICTNWKVGQTVRISQPRNYFPLDRTARRTILIGGGVGITPLIAMADHLAARGADFELHYCFRNGQRGAFCNELRAKPYAARVHLHASQERRFDFSGDVGAPDSDAHVYVCGPPGFMDSVLGQARAGGWRENQLHFELFGGEADASGSSFDVELDDGKTFHVPAGKTIAQVLVAEGYNIELNCERGFCGSCIAELKEGEADHRDFFFTDIEKMDNEQILLCCSRARTPSLSIVLEQA